MFDMGGLTMTLERFARTATNAMAAIGLALVIILPIGWMLSW